MRGVVRSERVVVFSVVPPIMGFQVVFGLLIRLVSYALGLIQFTLSVTAFSVPSPDINASTPFKGINRDIVMDYSDLLLFEHSHTP